MRRQFLFGCAVAGLALVAGCKDAVKDKSRPEVAGPTVIRDAVRLTGTVEPLDSVELKSEVSGKITKVCFREGDEVKRGQLVVLIDTVPFLLSRDKASLQVDRASLALKSADRDLARARDLVATGSVSKDRVEDLDIARSRAELDLRDARLTLRNAELDLSRTKIRAPMDGRLIRFQTEVGEVAASAVGVSGGTSLGIIADPTKLKVVVEVGELDYARLKLGMPVKVSTEGGRPISGKVSYVPSSARASSDTKTIKVFPVEVALDGQADGILPGMTVGVDFVFLERDAAVSVPYEAVKTGGKAGGKTGGWKQGQGSEAKAAATDSVTKVGGRDSAARSDSSRSGKHGKSRDGESRRFHREQADPAGRAETKPAGTWGGKPGTVMVRGEKGELVARQVKTGATDYRRIEILEGLSAGDTVFVQDDASSGSNGKSGQKRAGGPPF